MLLGQSPFRGEDEDEIFDAILHDEILYPVNMSRDAVSLLQRVRLKLLSESEITISDLLYLAPHSRPFETTWRRQKRR